MLRRSRVALALLLLLVLPVAPAAATSADWQWPVGGRSVDRPFEAPTSAYGPGHRGVDLATVPGAPVRAVAAGTVVFAGDVAGVPVVSVSHGRERSTYQPVEAIVAAGDAVVAGQPIGSILPGHLGCGAAACLHLGRLDGETYLDPTERLRSGGRFRLVDPDGPLPRPPALGTGELAAPVDGPVTSAYGRRVHPVTGVAGLHDGIDLAAACGTPVRAAASGTVRTAGAAGAYGLRVEIDHSDGRSTSYSHLSALGVSAGTQVEAGGIVGRVGSTGSSTGCHLHFSVHDGASTIDPAPLL